MGLDNGILLRTKKPLPADCPIDLEGIYEPDIYKGEWFEYEICYWRKCRNVREDIYYILKDDGADVTPDDVNGIMSKDALKAVWCKLYSYCEKSWDYPTHTIWEWEVMEDIIENQLTNIEWVIEFLSDYDGEYEIGFYDSY